MEEQSPVLLESTFTPDRGFLFLRSCIYFAKLLFMNLQNAFSSAVVFRQHRFRSGHSLHRKVVGQEVHAQDVSLSSLRLLLSRGY